jgi:hypothetical protein
LIKKGVNEGDYKNEENQIVIKDVLDRLLTSYEKRVIRARKSAQKSRDKKKAEKAKENEPRLSTELVAHTDEQVEQVEPVEPHTEVKQQDEPHTEVEKRVEKQVEKQVQNIQMEFQRKKEEPKKRHIWFS